MNPQQASVGAVIKLIIKLLACGALISCFLFTVIWANPSPPTTVQPESPLIITNSVPLYSVFSMAPESSASPEMTQKFWQVIPTTAKVYSAAPYSGLILMPSRVDDSSLHQPAREKDFTMRTIEPPLRLEPRK